ncbi:MAG: hypothetical protein ABSE56_11600 [Bryobacteraceae bacterium]
MPKIQFCDLPRGVWQHLLDRIEQRQVSLLELALLREWVRSGPCAPDGDWYRDFGSFVLCGSGPYPKTVLLRGMQPYGKELE